MVFNNQIWIKFTIVLFVLENEDLKITNKGWLFTIKKGYNYTKNIIYNLNIRTYLSHTKNQFNKTKH